MSNWAFWITIFLNHSKNPIYVLGAKLHTSLSILEIEELKEYCQKQLGINYEKEVTCVSTHSRALISGIMYHSLSYCKTKKRSNCCVQYHDNDQLQYGCIKFFLCLTTVSPPAYTICAITPLTTAAATSAPQADQDNLQPVQKYISKIFIAVYEEQKILYTQPENMDSVCILITKNDKQFVVRRPNKYDFINWQFIHTYYIECQLA